MNQKNSTPSFHENETIPRPVRGRFAPTPSGRMHLGNVLCALLAWLSARSAGGEMILRIEDLDVSRTSVEFTRLIQEDLLWLGLDWDEGGLNEDRMGSGEAEEIGPNQSGPHAPYEQSRRFSLYETIYQSLCDRGLVYPCFCSRAELHSAQAPHLSDGQVLYSGRCRGLSEEEIAWRRTRRSPASRLMVPDETIRFVDGHYGIYEENLASECGDFIIRRSDGVFAYQLAVVADDALMEISQVVRGRDLLSSTPRQLYLYRLLCAPPPKFFHIPLLLDPNGKQLSKRDKALDLGVLRQKYRPEDLLGLLAFCCGLLPKYEPVKARELISLFSWDQVSARDCVLPSSLF